MAYRADQGMQKLWLFAILGGRTHVPFVNNTQNNKKRGGKYRNIWIVYPQQEKER